MANKRRTCYASLVALRTCSVSCNDLQDVLHTVEVTAESLYEAVAKALVIFRQNDWVADIGTGLTPVTVVVKEPTVMHQVLMRDFERWLKRNGRSPAETASRSALRKQLGLGGEVVNYAALGTSSAAFAAIPVAQCGTPAAVRQQEQTVSNCPMKIRAFAKAARRSSSG